MMTSEMRLIDVNKVINSMQKCIDENPDKKYSVAYFAFESIIECLKQEPTVDAVEVVHAYWVGDEPGDWHCSHCGEYAADGGFEQTKYCPNCGAKMDGERKDNG